MPNSVQPRNAAADALLPLGDTATAVGEAAALGAALERGQAIPVEDVEAGLIARVLQREERIEIADLETTLAAPRACRGNARMYEPADFVSYVNRLGTASTTVWADPDASTVTAVFDDHTDGATPGWRRHRAVLVARRDPEWVAWLGRDNRLTSQEDFAEFVEEHLSAVVKSTPSDPEAADLLEVSRSFQAHRSASFERGTRLQSGDVQLRYVETTTASAGSKGHIEVPERFSIRVSPYLGVAPVDVVARLRYRIADGHLRIGYSLHRPDLVQQEAFDRIRAIVAENATADMHLGEAPDPLHPAARF
jgi:uncharacterized protein YfdQ (DUF2303 family)